MDILQLDIVQFQLAPYCLGPKETLDEFSEDPDRLLLSSIAEKVPQIHTHILLSIQPALELTL